MESGAVGGHLACRQAGWRKKDATSEQPSVSLFDLNNFLVLTVIQSSSDFLGLQQPWSCVCGTCSGNSTSRDIHRKDGPYGVDDRREV
jgi:hypothetical protein